MAGYVDRVITDAERANAPAVVFYMDTPGGLSDAMRDINLRILPRRCRSSSTSRRTARAGSAGVYISYAATWWHGAGDQHRLGHAGGDGRNGGEAQMSPR